MFETGARCHQIEFLFKFRYQAEYNDMGSENEICDVFVARDIQSDQLLTNEQEISEYKFLRISKFIEEIKTNSHKIVPWFLIAFNKFIQIREGRSHSKKK